MHVHVYWHIVVDITNIHKITPVAPSKLINYVEDFFQEVTYSSSNFNIWRVDTQAPDLIYFSRNNI